MFPTLNENTLIAICFPEFFFRGGRKGYYCVSRDRHEDNTSFFNRRYRYALNVASELLANLNQLMGELNWQSDSPPCITICAGTITVGSGTVDGEIQNRASSSLIDYLTVVDNYAIILTFSQKMSKANIIYKRTTSKFDFLKNDLSDYGPGVRVTHSRSLARFSERYAKVINSFDNLTTLYPSQTLHFIYRTQPLNMPFLPSIVLLDGAQAPHPHHIENSSVSIPAFTIGTSICLDYLAQIPAEEQRRREELKRNLIFYPSAGSQLRPQNPVNEAADNSIIIHADGGDERFESNVARVHGGVVQTVASSFDRLGKIEMTDIADQHKIFFTRDKGPRLIYRGSTSIT